MAVTEESERVSVAPPERGLALTIFAVCFALLAVSNLLKPLQLEGECTGFVLFGIRLAGHANTIASLIAAAYLLLYASGIWRMKRWALPMGHFYATYVLLNLFFYSMIHTRPPGIGYFLFMVIYSVVAIGFSVGAAVLLTSRKDELVH